MVTPSVRHCFATLNRQVWACQLGDLGIPSYTHLCFAFSAHEPQRFDSGFHALPASKLVLSCPECLFLSTLSLPSSQVSLYWIPQALFHSNSFPGNLSPSLFPVRQIFYFEILVIVDIIIMVFFLFLSISLLFIGLDKKKIIWTSGYYGKTGMKFLVNPILSIFYISWVFLNPVFILPPLILFFFWYVCGIATIIPIFKKRRVKLR